MRLLKSNPHWIYFFIFLVLGGLFTWYLNKSFAKSEMEAQAIRLENQHARTLAKFESSIINFAGLVSGMRSFVNLSDELPSADEFQQFVKNQYEDINSSDSIVVSFIDTHHVFKQSFTRGTMNPANLVGTSLATIRSDEKIKMFNKILEQDSLQVFPPLNLLEGWVGLPINFRVYRENEVLGYVAALVDFKSITNTIYTDAGADDFIFHFAIKDGADFDRERVYDNTHVYNSKLDSLYYKKFVTDQTHFLYSTVRSYGFDFTIGTAYKNPKLLKTGFSSVLLLWFFTFVLLAGVVTRQFGIYKKLNLKLAKANKALVDQKLEVKTRNEELKQLNETQHKFFSIIGHDIKQPLNAIEGLLYLLEGEEIRNPGLVPIVQNLKESTHNTVGLLNNLLRWALSQTGGVIFHKTRIEINKSIMNATSYMKQLAQEKQLNVVHEHYNDIEFHGDKDMIDTILRNLLSNAIKFSHIGGEILFRSVTIDERLHISIQDHGVGMDSDAVDALFTLKNQMSTTGTKGEKGTGLGLVLCEDFAKQHNGYIEVESTLNQGSTFTVILPLDERN
jgi:signal transduction histidine kinase